MIFHWWFFLFSAENCWMLSESTRASGIWSWSSSPSAHGACEDALVAWSNEVCDKSLISYQTQANSAEAHRLCNALWKSIDNCLCSFCVSWFLQEKLSSWKSVSASTPIPNYTSYQIVAEKDGATCGSNISLEHSGHEDEWSIRSFYQCLNHPVCTSYSIDHLLPAHSIEESLWIFWETWLEDNLSLCWLIQGHLDISLLYRPNLVSVVLNEFFSPHKPCQHWFRRPPIFLSFF